LGKCVDRSLLKPVACVISAMVDSGCALGVVISVMLNSLNSCVSGLISAIVR